MWKTVVVAVGLEELTVNNGSVPREATPATENLAQGVVVPIPNLLVEVATAICKTVQLAEPGAQPGSSVSPGAKGPAKAIEIPTVEKTSNPKNTGNNRFENSKLLRPIEFEFFRIDYIVPRNPGVFRVRLLIII